MSDCRVLTIAVPVRVWRRIVCVFAIPMMYTTTAHGLTSLLYDTEPNNAPHEAIDLSMPDGKDRVRIIGSLEGNDQDAYRLVVDDDHAGRRINMSLTGRSGALTRLDIFDFSELADGSGRIPNELTQRPVRVWTVRSQDGTRSVQDDALLLAPGVYVLGVSHSGGEGTYTVELSEFDDSRVRAIDEPATEQSPERASNRGNTVIWTQGETWYEFEIDQEQARQAWDVAFQTPANHPGEMALLGPDRSELLSIENVGGQPVTRPGLMLEPGQYHVRTRQKKAGVQMLRIESGAPAPVDGREVEPNDRLPTPVAFGEALSGRFDEDDTDWLAFTVDAEQAARRYKFELRGPQEAAAEVCLMRKSIGLNHCVRGRDGLVEMHSLGLVPGEYRMRMYDRGRAPATDWQLAWTDLGPVRPGEELEPNDDAGHPVAMHERGFGRGRFAGDETDHWRFSVTGEPQLWRAQLQGEDLHELTLKNASGKKLMSERAGSRQRVRLDNLFLLPGHYYLAASGTDSDYLLRLVELGPPPQGMELEPNDAVSNATPLRFGVEHFGTLSETKDSDRWSFKLNGHERIRLTVQPAVDGSMGGHLDAGDDTSYISRIANENNPGEALVWDMYLPPGDYSVQLWPGEVSDAEYMIALDRLDYLERIADREPNDGLQSAAPFPPDGRVHGSVGTTRENEDWYRLPVVAKPTELALARPDGVHMQLFARSTPNENRFEYDRETSLDRTTLAPREAHWLKISGTGEYDFDLSGAFGINPAAEALPPTVAIELQHDTIQAFSRWAQRLDGEIGIRNAAGRERTFDLETHITDARWNVQLNEETLTLAGGQSGSVGLVVRIPADVPARPAPKLSVWAGDAFGRAGSAIELTADTNAPPAAPYFYWAVPEALRGGFNAAALTFGARPVGGSLIEEDDIDDTEALFDGLARVGQWTEYRFPSARGTPTRYAGPTVELAGEEPVPVRGFLLNPTASLVPHGFIHEFRIAVSLDGERFETVFEGELEAIAEEQAFVLEEPVLARQVRLIPLSSQFAYTGYGAIRMGEFKVVAEPGWRPQADPFNLADPELGGHLVRADPWIRGSAYDKSLLMLDEKAASPRLHGQQEARVVLGFHHARSARIDRIAIEPLPEVRPERQAEKVAVAIAKESPLGPWQPLAEQDLHDGSAELVLDEPVWARYVRLTFEPVEGASRLQLPDRIAVYESFGPSVLGEWGFYSDTGPLEAANEPRWQALEGEPANAIRETAEPLPPGSQRTSRALLDSYSSWYRLEVPADTNLMTLQVSGRPSVEARPSLFDEAGAQVDLFVGERSVAQHDWEAYVEPGRTYWLELFEPPRSVIFSWDTSGSMAFYRPFIARALMNYAETIEPGRDEVNLLPFGRSEPLLANWQGRAYPLMRMLASYPRETSSSEAEKTLAVAAREMIDRPGKKGVVLLTDAATTTHASLWPALKEGQPQVFAMKLSSEGALGPDPKTEVDLMQDWAQVRGGQFSYVTSFGALDHGFERAVARLKAPVDFSVAVAYEQAEDPAPASIAVVSGGAGATGGDPAARGAVEIILDASGSMLKRMDGRRRIDIAKDAVRGTVEATLPEGVPTALRVYGHKEAGSCRTDLEIPLSPLDKSVFLDRLGAIEAINLAKTPIADSLSAVASDLGDSQDRRLVVLLTDGEETCDGDPAAEIERLKEAGFDVRINIVGFAIDNEHLKDEFAEWARLGGGEYLDAGEAGALGDAMERALQVPFAVIDAADEEVARGLVDGEAVEVPPGRYSVRIDTAGPRMLRDVSLAPGEAREIGLD